MRKQQPARLKIPFLKLGVGITITISFEDRGTGTTLNSVSGTINGPINPGAVVPFDVDTGYNRTQAHQFQNMKVQLTH